MVWIPSVLTVFFVKNIYTWGKRSAVIFFCMNKTRFISFFVYRRQSLDGFRIHVLLSLTIKKCLPILLKKDNSVSDNHVNQYVNICSIFRKFKLCLYYLYISQSQVVWTQKRMRMFKYVNEGEAHRLRTCFPRPATSRSPRLRTQQRLQVQQLYPPKRLPSVKVPRLSQELWQAVVRHRRLGSTHL